MRKILKDLLSIFGYQLCRNQISLIDPLMWSYIKDNDPGYTLYNKAIQKSKNEHTNNLPKICRHFSLIQCLNMVLSREIDGDFVECGVWRGHSAYIIADLIRNISRSLHIFDSFEGGLSNKLPEDSIETQSLEQEVIESKIFSSTEQQVRNTLYEFPFVKIYKGWIPDRFHEVEELVFSFVHIDVDLYQPTKDSLEFFWPRLSGGGMIICDDYGISQFPGAKRAVDQFLKLNKTDLFYEVPLGGCFFRKP